MRHLSNIWHDYLPCKVLSYRKCYLWSCLCKFLILDQVSEHDHLVCLIRNLDSDCRLSGIGASILISAAARFNLISSARLTILLTFTPCSGCNSNCVTDGPQLILVIVTWTPKSSNVFVVFVLSAVVLLYYYSMFSSLFLIAILVETYNLLLSSELAEESLLAWSLFLCLYSPMISLMLLAVLVPLVLLIVLQLLELVVRSNHQNLLHLNWRSWFFLHPEHQWSFWWFGSS